MFGFARPRGETVRSPPPLPAPPTQVPPPGQTRARSPCALRSSTSSPRLFQVRGTKARCSAHRPRHQRAETTPPLLHQPARWHPHLVGEAAAQVPPDRHHPPTPPSSPPH